MHNDFLAYPGEKEPQWWMAGSRAVMKELLEDEPNPERVFAWGKTPAGVSLQKVKSLTLYDQPRTQKALPECLKEFSSLVYLSLPLHLLKTIKGEWLPKSLKTLRLDGDEAGELPKGITLPSVVQVFSDGTLAFEASQLPNLAKLSVRLPTKGSLEPIPQLKKLVGLDVGPVKDGAVFGALAPLGLSTLFLTRGSLTSLSGIEKLGSVTGLRLNQLKKLTDLTPLLQLPELTELSLMYCSSLTKVDALLKLKKLTKLKIFGCTDKGGHLAALLPALKKRKLSELDADLDED
jgi:Leucine-rich repeat (LRR) protein